MDSTKIVLSTTLITFGFILDMLFFYLMVLYFDIEIIGYYSVLASFFLSLKFITGLGFSIAHLKFYHEAKNPMEQATYNGVYFFFRIIQFSSYSVIILILIPIIPLYDGNISVVYVFFIAVTLRIEQLVQPLYLIKKHVLKKGMSLIITFAVRIILLISLHDFFLSNIWFLINIILISNFIYLIVNIFWLRKIKLRKPIKTLIKKYFIFAYPFFIISSMNIIFQNIDVLIVNSWVSVADVANFYTAKKFYLIFTVFTFSISNILITTFSKNVILGRKEENYELMRGTHKFLNLVTIPLVFLIALYSSKVLIFIFGQDYTLTGMNLSIIIFALIPLSLNCTVGIQFKAMGKTKLWALIIIIKSVIRLVMLLILTAPIFLNLGVIGASLAIPLTAILTELIIRPVLYKKYNISFYWGSFRNFAIMGCIFILQLFINEIIFYPVYYIPLFLLLDTGLYFLINYILQGFSKEDIRFVINIVSIKNLKKQIVAEMKN